MNCGKKTRMCIEEAVETKLGKVPMNGMTVRRRRH